MASSRRRTHDVEEEAQAGGDRCQAAPGRCPGFEGQNVSNAIRAIGVTEVTYYRWRQEYGGLKTDQIRRMKDLETENARLRKAIADLTLDKLILQEASRGNYFSIRGSWINPLLCASSPCA